ncbi:MAG: hypothetical protein AUH29_11875 [Candidatus Rokubacteria bacterium 13_1_40CM_69_27]|nr:MAG: hypothetical protein AUH29_11875 [Candidatus Rokubacteria bacterium 13_1_40CM_69_27]OLE36858.1 MAG: hypothetical protein AUG00_09695 [Candidatus Rokubacteria bacterium 13_1_20CM_2_70_7]
MKTIATIALAVALGLAWVGVAIPATAAEVKEETKSKAEDVKDKLKSAGEKIKDKAVEVKDKVKEKVQGNKGNKEAAGSERVRSAQEALRDKGFDPGPIDGVMGPKTRAAVTNFQKKEGLKATGRLDVATMSRLGMDTTTGAAEPSAPSASPTTSPPPAATPSKPEAPKRQPSR